ncbi:hypothetical protein FSP39_010916 [Pinctada imbricata]|uniref:Uncharacterized protein n=1 Tax=Pinctada imbricata TaxID=66713 RepID=A0AA89C1D8_PINIB|nr:hypothetical protein FSP39_010916 [Pinctada imbricata]
MHISPIAILVVVLWNYPISGAKLKEACKVLKEVNGNIDKNYPRPNGCIMEFTTARGKCCAIGFRKVHKLIFHEKFLMDKTCYRFRCRYLKGKKKKRWEKCGCKKNKIKLTQKTTLKPSTTKHTTRPPTTTIKVTTRPPTTTPKPPGCVVNGQFYPHWSEIPELGGQQDNWCYGAICGDDGKVMHWDNFNCNPTTTRKTTIPPTTTHPPGCYIDGKLYDEGQDIPKFDGKIGNWCFGKMCGPKGKLLSWDNYDCDKTTSKTTTPPLSTKVPGCRVLGKFYKVDEDIPELFKKEGNYCVSYFCNEKLELEKWEDYNCGGTTPPELLLSTPPMRMPTEPIPYK